MNLELATKVQEMANELSTDILNSMPYVARDWRVVEDIKTGNYSVVLQTKIFRDDFKITAYCKPDYSGTYVRLVRYTDVPFKWTGETGIEVESDANGQGVQYMNCFVGATFHMEAINEVMARITTHELDDELVQLGRDADEE